jgi:perosamine synthetase
MEPIPWPQPKKLTCPVADTWLTPLESKYVEEAISHNWIGPNGSFNQRAETKFGDMLGQRALLVSNGSVALMLGLRALGIGAGDEVLLPNLTYAATASSVVNVGATPVLCDVEEKNWGISIESMKRMLTHKSRAIIVVHLYGAPANIEQILSFASENNLKVIEDCAEALFATRNSKTLGTFGDVSTFSFFANKLITSGEGGAVSARENSIIEKMTLLRGQGMDSNFRYYFREPGYNFRLTNLQAAILLAQLERFDEIKQSRASIEEHYRSQLRDHIIMQEVGDRDTRAPWIFTARLKGIELATKLDIVRDLAKDGVETRPIFYPLSHMPAFEKYPTDSSHECDLISLEGISLPTGHHIDLQKVEMISKVVIEGLKNAQG